MTVNHAFHFPVSHQKISAALLPFSLYCIIYVKPFCFECIYFFLSDLMYVILIIMFYRQELFLKYSQQFHTLFQELDVNLKKTKEEGTNLAVGFRFHFKISLL